uniref:Uncharacterized protein n=1 Tax=Romanomermis culicivorax TaxID=13658 RepID=A0A915KAU8_ROMCU
MYQENPEEVLIANPPMGSTSAVRSEDVIQGEKLMEAIDPETKKQEDMEILLDQIKEMKQKIKMLEKERYGKEAIELAKQIETGNEKEETSKEPYVEVVWEIASKEEEATQLNALPASPVCAKAGG